MAQAHPRIHERHAPRVDCVLAGTVVASSSSLHGPLPVDAPTYRRDPGAGSGPASGPVHPPYAGVSGPASSTAPPSSALSGPAGLGPGSSGYIGGSGVSSSVGTSDGGLGEGFPSLAGDNPASTPSWSRPRGPVQQLAAMGMAVMPASPPTAPARSFGGSGAVGGALAPSRELGSSTFVGAGLGLGDRHSSDQVLVGRAGLASFGTDDRQVQVSQWRDA